MCRMLVDLFALLSSPAQKNPPNPGFLLWLSAIHHQGENIYLLWHFSDGRVPVRSSPGKAQWHTSRPHCRTAAAAEALLLTLPMVQTCSLNNIWQLVKFMDLLLICLIASPPQQKLPAVPAAQATTRLSSVLSGAEWLQGVTELPQHPKRMGIPLLPCIM